MGREYDPYTYSLKVPPKTDNVAQGTASKEDVSPEFVVLTLKTVAEEQPETRDSAQPQYTEIHLRAKRLTSHATCDLLADSLLHVMKDKQKGVLILRVKLFTDCVLGDRKISVCAN